MTGQESNPALLFQLYVDYGRYREATNLLLEYIGSFASMVNCSLFFSILSFCITAWVKKKIHDVNLAFLKVNAIASYRKAAAIKGIEREFMLLSFILDSSLAVWL